MTANVSLWPRPLVVVMGNEAYESLTDGQRTALHKAAVAAIPKALEESRAEDEEAAAKLCRRGMTFVNASDSDLAELRAAFEPVYAELASNPETKSYIDTITSLKTEIAVSADAPACQSESGEPAAAEGIPEGTYETTLTRDDWVAAGVDGGATGVFTMEFTDGVLILREPNDQVGFEAPYTLFRDTIEAVGDPDTVTAQWSFDGTRLTFKDVGSCIGTPCTPAGEANPYTVVWGSHPWVRVEPKSSSIDGVYRTTVTRNALERSPLLYEPGEVNHENWGELTLIFDQGRVTFEQENDVTSTSTTGTYKLDGDTLVLDFTEGVNAGEMFSVRWSVFRDQLTFSRDEELGIIPTPYLIEPWDRVE